MEGGGGGRGREGGKGRDVDMNLYPRIQRETE